MPQADYAGYLDFADRVAREAGSLLLDAYGRVSAREKGPGDLVTDADLASQRAIASALARTYPDHTLLAEEEGVRPDPSRPFRWVVDPIDGTVNFAHGYPLWCVSIALEHAGEPVVGVIHVPPLGTTYRAAKGLGATLDGRPLRVSGAGRLAESLIATGLPADFAADADRQMALMRRFSTNTHSLRRTGTTAWNLAQVAAGGCEVCYATHVYPWDVAAGIILIREAGGTVTALDGSPYDPEGPTILATNGHVHAEALRAAAEAWPG